MSWMIPPACVFCEHFHSERNEHTDDLPSCDAFKAIPEEIFFGEHDHSLAYPGDGGVRFSVNDHFHHDFLDVNNLRRKLGMKVYRIPLKLVG